MFEKFGEFDSVEELNRAAEGLKKEGDMEALKALAEENGIDREDVEDYIDNWTDSLTNVSSAAFGRLKLERRDSEKYNAAERAAVNVIITMAEGMCMREDFAAAVMKKGKRIHGIYEAMKNAASEHKSGNCGVSCGTDRQLVLIIEAYYMRSSKELKKELEKLY